jgi:hypothetical protein
MKKSIYSEWTSKLGLRNCRPRIEAALVALLCACSSETASSPLSTGSSEEPRHTYIVDLTDLDQGASASCLSDLHDLAGLRKLYDSRWMFYTRISDRTADQVRVLPCVSSLVEVAERPYILELTDLDHETSPLCMEEISSLTDLTRSGYSKRNFEFTAPEFIAYEVSQLECVAKVSLRPFTSFFSAILARPAV